SIPPRRASELSRKGGLEIECTEPVGAMANQPGLYTLQHWHYTPTFNYYNDPQGVAPLAVSGVQVSVDRKRVYLELGGMTAGKVVHLKLGPARQSESGQALWTSDAYYTLNSISESQPQLITSIAPFSDVPSPELIIRKASRTVTVRWNHAGFTTLSIRNLKGMTLKTFDVTGLKTFSLPENPGH